MDHLKRSLMTKNLNRFDILNHFGVGAALAPIHGGFLACGGVKNQLGKVCINLEFISGQNTKYWEILGCIGSDSWRIFSLRWSQESTRKGLRQFRVYIYVQDGYLTRFLS